LGVLKKSKTEGPPGPACLKTPGPPPGTKNPPSPPPPYPALQASPSPPPGRFGKTSIPGPKRPPPPPIRTPSPRTLWNIPLCRVLFVGSPNMAPVPPPPPGPPRGPPVVFVFPPGGPPIAPFFFVFFLFCFNSECFFHGPTPAIPAVGFPPPPHPVPPRSSTPPPTNDKNPPSGTPGKFFTPARPPPPPNARNLGPRVGAANPPPGLGAKKQFPKTPDNNFFFCFLVGTQLAIKNNQQGSPPREITFFNILEKRKNPNAVNFVFFLRGSHPHRRCPPTQKNFQRLPAPLPNKIWPGKCNDAPGPPERPPRPPPPPWVEDQNSIFWVPPPPPPPPARWWGPPRLKPRPPLGRTRPPPTVFPPGSAGPAGPPCPFSPPLGPNLPPHFFSRAPPPWREAGVVFLPARAKPLSSKKDKHESGTPPGFFAWYKNLLAPFFFPPVFSAPTGCPVASAEVRNFGMRKIIWRKTPTFHGLQPVFSRGQLAIPLRIAGACPARKRDAARLPPPLPKTKLPSRACWGPPPPLN